jgi:hypothetical protein
MYVGFGDVVLVAALNLFELLATCRFVFILVGWYFGAG